MTPAQRRELGRRLQALERELTAQGPSSIEPARGSPEQAGHDEDAQPLTEMLQAIASNRNRNHAQLLIWVRKALRRLAEDPDTFGECDECGEQIAFGRLRLMPYVEKCTDCQAKADGPKGPATRRKLTDYR